jgi:hypothetical protein
VLREAAALLAVLGIAPLAGCVHEQQRSASREHAREPTARAAERDVAEPTLDGGYARAPSISLRAPREESRVLRIGAAPAPVVHPVSHRRINIDLKAAPLADALRFIADAGGFNLVVEGDLSAPVTLKLTGVDAFDALATVAEAQGLDVEMERGIVIVGSATAHGNAAQRAD